MTGNLEDQTKRTMDGIKQTFDAAGASFKDVCVALLEFNFMLAKLILIPPLLPLKFEGRLFGHRLGLYLVSIELMDAAENG
ncbi:MAG: hypothetical protein ACXU9C_29280 [Xanthobacteraceae bacterium]